MEKENYLDYINKLRKEGYDVLVNKKQKSFKDDYSFDEEPRYFSCLYNKKDNIFLTANSYYTGKQHILNNKTYLFSFIEKKEGITNSLGYNSMSIEASHDHPLVVRCSTTSIDKRQQDSIEYIKAPISPCEQFIYLEDELIFEKKDISIARNYVKNSGEALKKQEYIYKKSLKNLQQQYYNFINQLPKELRENFKDYEPRYFASIRLIKNEKINNFVGNKLNNFEKNIILQINNALKHKINIDCYRETIKNYLVLKQATKRKDYQTFLEKKFDTDVLKIDNSNDFFDVMFLSYFLKNKKMEQFLFSKIDDEALIKRWSALLSYYTDKNMNLTYLENLLVGKFVFIQGKFLYINGAIKHKKNLLKLYFQNNPLTVNLLDICEKENKFNNNQVLTNFVKSIELLEKNKINYYGSDKIEFFEKMINHESIKGSDLESRLELLKTKTEKQQLKTLLNINTKKVSFVNKL